MAHSTGGEGRGEETLHCRLRSTRCCTYENDDDVDDDDEKGTMVVTMMMKITRVGRKRRDQPPVWLEQAGRPPWRLGVPQTAREATRGGREEGTKERRNEGREEEAARGLPASSVLRAPRSVLPLPSAPSRLRSPESQRAAWQQSSRYAPAPDHAPSNKEPSPPRLLITPRIRSSKRKRKTARPTATPFPPFPARQSQT